MSAIPLENTPASYPDVVALAQRYHPLNVWKGRVSPRLPSGVNREKAYAVFLRAYGETLDRRRLKRGGSGIKVSGEESIDLNPVFVQKEEFGLRATYKGQRAESFLLMDKEDRIAYLWAWWAWNQLPEDQRHPNTVQFLKRLEQSSSETTAWLLIFISNPALALSGNWSADFNRIYEEIRRSWQGSDGETTFHSLIFMLQSFYPDGGPTRPLRFMYMPSPRSEKKDFQTPEMILAEWRPEAKVDLRKWEAAIQPLDYSRDYDVSIPQWWRVLSRRPVARKVDPAHWTKLVESELDRERKERKLRRGTQAYEDFLIKELPGVSDRLTLLIKEANEANASNARREGKDWMDKAEAAQREIKKLRDLDRADKSARRAFAEFYGVPLPAELETSAGYTVVLDLLDDVRDEVLKLNSLLTEDDFVRGITQKALRGVSEIEAVWAKVKWPAGLGR